MNEDEIRDAARAAQSTLREIGVTFDSGAGLIHPDEPPVVQWHLDWSLEGAEIETS